MKSEYEQAWDESPVAAPLRTRLYSLEPIGVGTSMVECFSSYIHRLAAAHGIPTWVLICREIGPRFERKSIIAPNGHCDLFGSMGMTINGNNKTALEAVMILQALTGQKTLHSLTFCRLGSLVAECRILRGKQAWCPECLEQWCQDSKPVHQPLIWMLSALQTCPTHGCLLEDHCPSCAKQHTSLGRHRWNGNCPRCSAWLGKPRNDGRRGNTPLSEWEPFAASVLGRFVAAMQSLPDDVPQPTFPSNVTDLIRNRFGGNFSALARALRVHRSTVFDWANGAQRPSPASLVALTYCFGSEAVDWITGRVGPANMHETRPIEQTVAASVRPPLQRHHPEIVRAHLTSVIQAAENPPSSFAAVCKRLGVHQTMAKRLFPDLAVGIMSKYRIIRAEGKRTRENFRKNLVESAVHQLLAEGRTLSYNQLCKVLPPGVSARDKLVRCEFTKYRAKSIIA